MPWTELILRHSLKVTPSMASRSTTTPVSVSLRRLFPRASFVGCGDIQVTDATERSSDVQGHSLFAAIPGTRVDGTQFIAEAIQRGAGSLLVQQPLGAVDIPQCVVPNVRRAFAELCAAMQGHPARRLSVAGVTGTNGKTTTAWLIRSILETAGKRTGLLGTIECSDGIQRTASNLTTPDAKSLASWLGRMRANGCRHATLEVSSHALDQDRAAGVALDVAIVTNITQDHFDYHPDFDHYRNSKACIASLCKKGGLVVLNADDAGSSSLRGRIDAGLKMWTIGIDNPADVFARIQNESLAGTDFVLTIGTESAEASTSLVGRHNVSNCLAAAAAAHHLGVPLSKIVAGIEAMTSVPGRLERITVGQDFDVFVDYAHTDDALRRCIRFLKPLTRGRLIVVFGAGGDRDRTKRPLLGKAATEADLVVVTSDNPRTESPEQIIHEILAGFAGSPRQPFVQVDRAAAIRWALQHAGPQDCVLIAGKGHETEQIIGAERHPFDDRQVARSILQEIQQAPELRVPCVVPG